MRDIYTAESRTFKTIAIEARCNSSVHPVPWEARATDKIGANAPRSMQDGRINSLREKLIIIHSQNTHGQCPDTPNISVRVY